MAAASEGGHGLQAKRRRRWQHDALDQMGSQQAIGTAASYATQDQGARGQLSCQAKHDMRERPSRLAATLAMNSNSRAMGAACDHPGGFGAPDRAEDSR